MTFAARCSTLRRRPRSRPGLSSSALSAEPAGVWTYRFPMFVLGSRRSSCLLREGLGRAPQAEEKPAPRLPESAAAIEKMSWQEMQSLAAILMVDDLVAVQRRGANVVLRERVAALPESERRVLREALAEPV